MREQQICVLKEADVDLKKEVEENATDAKGWMESSGSVCQNTKLKRWRCKMMVDCRKEEKESVSVRRCRKRRVFVAN